MKSTNIKISNRLLWVVMVLFIASLACGRGQETVVPEVHQAPVDAGDSGISDASGATLFEDDFQDGQAEDWQINAASWYVQQSGDSYYFGAAGDGGAWLPQGQKWSEYAFRTRVRVEGGSLFLSFNLTQNGRYMVQLDENGLFLLKEEPADNFIVLAQTCPVDMGDWHWIAAGSQNGHIQVYVDQNLWIDTTDTNPIPMGTIAVSSLAGSTVAVDDVSVAQLTSPLPGRAVEAPTGCDVASSPIDSPSGDDGGLTLEDVDEDVDDGDESPSDSEQESEQDEEEQDNQQQDEQDDQGDEHPMGQPELHVSLITITPSSPDQGQEVTVAVTVFNGGEADAGVFNVRWYPEGDGSFVGCSWDIDGLVAGVAVDRSCSYQGYPNAGTFHWVVIADADAEVAESIENNNQQANDIIVHSAAVTEPPPAPTDCVGEAFGRVSINFYWQYPEGVEIDGFHIYQGVTSLEGTVSAGNRGGPIDNLAAGTQYHFDVRAYNAAGESPADACFVDVMTDQ